ncbi:hypothetical protein ABT272_37360 [Streptomyces sp900105245]|uniref:Uncharacterized protein n=1 Tax=Streptomyces sp. 900105245 TaxID=3154379 RepID=A0ABV1UI20_9ACTN
MQPDHGYRAERREADRALYSADVKGRTKVAVVVAKDQNDRPGWGPPETNAACDPAELPAAQGWEVWTDGARVPVSRLESSASSPWAGGRTYVRDPEGVLARDGLLSVVPQAGPHARGRPRHQVPLP